MPDILVQHTVFDQPKGFAFESIRRFVDCMLSGTPFHVSLQDASHTTLALLAIMESAKTRMPVELLKTFTAITVISTCHPEQREESHGTFPAWPHHIAGVQYPYLTGLA